MPDASPTESAALDAFSLVVSTSLIDEAVRALLAPPRGSHQAAVASTLARTLAERRFAAFDDPAESFRAAELGDGPDLPQYDLVKALASLTLVHTWVDPAKFAVTAQLFMATRLIIRSPHIDTVAPPVAAHLMRLAGQAPSRAEYDIAISVLMAHVGAQAMARAGPDVHDRDAALRRRGILNGPFMAQQRETMIIAKGERAARELHQRLKTMRETLE